MHYIINTYRHILAALSLIVLLTACINNEDIKDINTVSTDSSSGVSNESKTERITRFVKKAPIMSNDIGVYILDMTTNDLIYHQREDSAMVPASCVKLITLLTTYHTTGLDHTFRSKVTTLGTISDSTLRGEVILDMDDDPLFVGFGDVADSLLCHGIRRIYGHITLRLKMEKPLSEVILSKGDIAFDKLPVLCKGREYIEQNLYEMLDMKGITYERAPIAITYDKLTTIASPTHSVRDLLHPMIKYSSNIYAEQLAIHLQRFEKEHHIIANDDSTFILNRYLMRHHRSWISYSPNDIGRHDDIWPRDSYKVYDASGLSQSNRLTARQLIDVCIKAYHTPPLHELLIDSMAMAVPGDSTVCGSLWSKHNDKYRMRGTVAEGRIYCKTGTLPSIGTSSLAGYCHAANGHWYVYAIIINNSPVEEGRLLQDSICVALAE